MIVPIHAKLHVVDPKMFAVTVEKPGGVVVSDRKHIAVLAKTDRLERASPTRLVRPDFDIRQPCAHKKPPALAGGGTDSRMAYGSGWVSSRHLSALYPQS